MSSIMHNKMAGRIATLYNLLDYYHQIHVSSMGKQLLVYGWLAGQQEISYQYWSDPRHAGPLACVLASFVVAQSLFKVYPIYLNLI